MASIQCPTCKYNVIGGGVGAEKRCPNCGNSIIESAASYQAQAEPIHYTPPSSSSYATEASSVASSLGRGSTIDSGLSQPLPVPSALASQYKASSSTKYASDEDKGFAKPFSKTYDKTITDPEIPSVVTVDSYGSSQWNKMFKKPADLRGVVVHQQTQSNPKWKTGIFDILFNELINILWPVNGAQNRNLRQDKNKQIVQVRVRSADNKQHEVRFEGDFSLGSIALGDEVSLWGYRRKGTLIVRRAFNHTTDARVVVRVQMDDTNSGILILLGLMACLIIAMVWLKWLTFTPMPQFHFPTFFSLPGR